MSYYYYDTIVMCASYISISCYTEEDGALHCVVILAHKVYKYVVQAVHMVYSRHCCVLYT